MTVSIWWSDCGLEHVARTQQPRDARLRTMARPIPRVPPVTTATLSARSWSRRRRVCCCKTWNCAVAIWAAVAESLSPAWSGYKTVLSGKRMRGWLGREFLGHLDIFFSKKTSSRFVGVSWADCHGTRSRILDVRSPHNSPAPLVKNASLINHQMSF